jgi:hypothetical protein
MKQSQVTYHHSDTQLTKGVTMHIKLEKIALRKNSVAQLQLLREAVIVLLWIVHAINGKRLVLSATFIPLIRSYVPWLRKLGTPTIAINC